MDLPDLMIQSSDISIVTGFTEHYESTTTSPDWVEVSYFHAPIIVIGFLCLLLFWFISRMIIEILMRWRK